MNFVRPLLFAVILLAFGASSPSAIEPGKFFVSPGVTEIEYEGVTVRVEASGYVIVQLSLINDTIVGQVSTAPGTHSANVLIVVADDPERVIFNGRVVAPSWFADYLPQETGRGEQ